MAADNIINKMREYGADIEGTMERMADDVDLYITCLKLFVKEENLFLLKSALEEEDYNKAFEIAHTIKGVVANLGLTPLFDIVFQLVEKLRAGKHDNVWKDYCDMEIQYESIKEILI